jgi:hypothetical protein
LKRFAFLFALLSFIFLFARVLDLFLATMSESGEIFFEKDSSNDGGNFDNFANIDPHEEPTILHTQKL